MTCKSCNSKDVQSNPSEYRGDYSKKTYYCRNCGVTGTKFYDKIYIRYGKD